MMRRAPFWFTNPEKRERFHRYWPWALGVLCAGLYQYNPYPFDDLMRGGLSSFRKPLLGLFEKIEQFDIDPELMALELPPDQLFGPLPLKQQIFFILQALEEDNELGDHYITRLVIDLLDFSLDAPALGNTYVEAGGSELFQEAVKRYRGYDSQKIRFFNHDQFLRLASVSCEHKSIARTFLKDSDAVKLVLQGVRECTDEYSKYLGMRTLMFLAMYQERDGEVEKRIAQDSFGISTLLDVYNKASGDPHETRYVTSLLSSVVRLCPSSVDKFLQHEGLEVLFRAFNITMYKAIPQHLRLYEDVCKLRPKEVDSFLKSSEDVIPVVLGVMASYQDFREAQGPLCEIVRRADDQKQDPSLLFSYGALSTFSRLHARFGLREREDGTPIRDAIPQVNPDPDAIKAMHSSAHPSVVRLFKCMHDLSHRILNDKTAQPYFDYSPEVRLAVSNMKEFTEHWKPPKPTNSVKKG